MRVAVLALLCGVGCGGGDAPGAKAENADSGGGAPGGDTDGVACVYGTMRSDETIDVYGEVDDVRGEIPLEGVQVVDCESGAGGLSGGDGGWTAPSRDASYVTLLAEIDGAPSARWLFDPRVEGIPEMPFRQDMVWDDVLEEIFTEVGVIRDPNAVVVVIEAMDPDTRVDLADAVVSTVPPAESYLRISLEGSPELSNTTNGLHDVAALNVPAGGISIVVDAGPDRTCRVPDALTVPAGGLLALTAYCPVTAR
jgi:hypothetical protein